MMYEGMRTKMMLEVCAFVGHERPEQWEEVPIRRRMVWMAAYSTSERPTRALLEEIVREATLLRDVEELTAAISEP